MNPHINPMRNAPTLVKYLATVALACLWCLAFSLYTAQFFYIDLNILAHVAMVTMVFVTWSTFRGFRRAYPDTYPLMRDPHFSPKCYEMTEAEKLQSIGNADQLLEKQSFNASPAAMTDKGQKI